MRSINLEIDGFDLIERDREGTNLKDDELFFDTIQRERYYREGILRQRSAPYLNAFRGREDSCVISDQPFRPYRLDFYFFFC